MLREVKHVLQKEESNYRRWFDDDYFDLIIWYDADFLTEKSAHVIGFQLCYDKQEKEKVLTWRQKYGFTHDAVDKEDPEMKNISPVLIADGLFQATTVLKEFEKRSYEVDKNLKKFVIEKIEEFCKNHQYE